MKWRGEVNTCCCSCCCGRSPRGGSNLREEGFVLAHSLREHSPAGIVVGSAVVLLAAFHTVVNPEAKAQAGTPRLTSASSTTP